MKLTEISSTHCTNTIEHSEVSQLKFPNIIFITGMDKLVPMVIIIVIIIIIWFIKHQCVEGPQWRWRTVEIMQTNALVTCEIKNFSIHRHPSEIILFQHVETCLKLFHRLIAAHEYFPTCSLSLK